MVFVLGLEEGSLPRRSRSSPFLDDDRRRELGRRLERPDAVSRDRYLFYTACTRATRRLLLVREAASDDGAPREASPFWDEARAVFEPEDVEPRDPTARALAAHLADRRRLRPSASGSARSRGSRADPGQSDLALALADANDWTRRLRRARSAFERRTALRSPVVLDGSAAARRSAPPSSSGSSTAPRPGSSSG